MFADDSLLFRTIENDHDGEALQKDLDSLLSWAETWQMKFHPDKCFVMSITNNKHPIKHNYQILGHSLANADTIPYLGVQLNKSLKWNNHIENIVAKASRSLGFLRRNLYQCPEKVKEQAYIALVRPILEYSCAVWDPYQQTQIKMLEQVQRTAARFVTNCRSTQPGCVTAALTELNWSSLESRRKDKRLGLLHKAVSKKEASAMKLPEYYNKQTSKYNTRNHHINRLSNPLCRTNVGMNSFFPRTIREWNSIPGEILDITNTEQFLRIYRSYERQLVR